MIDLSPACARQSQARGIVQSAITFREACDLLHGYIESPSFGR